MGGPAMKCAAGRMRNTGHSHGGGCRTRPVDGKFYCELHQAEALARVQTVMASKRGDRPRPWVGWLVRAER